MSPRGRASAPVRRAGSALAIVVAALGQSAPLAGQIRGVVVDEARPGQRAPALVLPWAQGEAEPYALARELGLVVLVAFCPRAGDRGCLEAWRGWQLPDSVFGGPVSVVGVIGEPAAAFLAAAEEQGLQGRFLSDARGVAGRRWGVPVPREGELSVFVVGREGMVVYRDLQFRPADLQHRARLARAISESLSGSAVR